MQDLRKVLPECFLWIVLQSIKSLINSNQQGLFDCFKIHPILHSCEELQIREHNRSFFFAMFSTTRLPHSFNSRPTSFSLFLLRFHVFISNHNCLETQHSLFLFCTVQERSYGVLHAPSLSALSGRVQVPLVQGIFPFQECSHCRLPPWACLCLFLMQLKFALLGKVSFRIICGEQVLFSYVALSKPGPSVDLELSRLVRLEEMLRGCSVFLNPINGLRTFLLTNLSPGIVYYHISTLEATFSFSSQSWRRNEAVSLW